MNRSSRFIVFSSMLVLAFPFWGCVAQDSSAIYRQRSEERKKQYAAQSHYIARYDIVLVDVDRPTQAKERYGDISLSKVQPGNTSINLAEDQLIKIAWLPPDRTLAFDLLNKTGQSLKIAWNESAYVDISAHSHSVIHTSPSSLVPSKSRLADSLTPADIVPSMFFPCIRPGYICESSHRQYASAHKHLTYRILLPLQMGPDIYHYIFTFKVNNVEIISDKKEESEKKAPEVVP